MDVYAQSTIGKLISGNPYVGRGIVLGMTPDAQNAVSAYFIMGRSENSRNRIFVENGDEVIIHPFDDSKVEDPSLIIYSPIRKLGAYLIVTNGDQTDTVYDYMKDGKSFEAALETRQFEPDCPNFTPRISGVVDFSSSKLSYKLNILKSADKDGTVCSRFNFSYTALPSVGHFLHTYVTDGNPIPTFMGEPERVELPNSIDELTNDIWNNLDKANRISLYVRFVSLKDGSVQNRMININS